MGFVLVVFLVTTSSLVNSIATNSACFGHCDCNDKLESLSCTGVKKVSLPFEESIANYTSFKFSYCEFEDPFEIRSIPYPKAKDLIFEKCFLLKRFSDNAFENLTSLYSLIIEGSPLLTISGKTFEPLKELGSLDLSDNDVKTITEDLFKFPKLVHLDLSHNKNITFATNCFNGVSQTLTRLLCMECGLTSVPKNSLSPLIQLTTLNLNSNPIRDLDDAPFEFNTELQELNLDNCNLVHISANAFRGLRNLRILNLGHNQISSLDSAFLKPSWTSLHTLYLEHNNLTSMQSGVASWRSLTDLKLGFNPWHCDCELIWTVTYEIGRVDSENVTCASPSNLLGHDLFNAETKLRCDAGRSRVVLGIGIPILIGIGLILAYYIYQWTNNYRRRARQRASFKYSTVYGDTVESNSKQSILS